MASQTPDDTVVALKEAVSLLHSVYLGQSRPLVGFVVKILNAYENTQFALSDLQIDALTLDLARLVSSQVHSPEAQAARISEAERILAACDTCNSIGEMATRLSRIDLASARDALDFVMRLGILQFDRVSQELQVYPHMYESGILLENSPALTRHVSQPAIHNKSVPKNIKDAYEGWSKLKESYNDRYMSPSNGYGG